MTWLVIVVIPMLDRLRCVVVEVCRVVIRRRVLGRVIPLAWVIRLVARSKVRLGARVAAVSAVEATVVVTVAEPMSVLGLGFAADTKREGRSNC